MDSESGRTVSVRLVDVTRRFGDLVAVDRVGLEVHSGEFFGLLGPNGAGKSTIIKMVTGLLDPSAGRIEVLGRDIRRDPIEVKRRIGLLPEDSSLYERLTGEEYLQFVGRMYGLPEDDVQRRVAELLEILDLEPRKAELIIDYSMGMKKKIGLAAALIHSPEIILLDEPFNGVDVVSSRIVKDILQRLVERGVTIVFSSHVMEMVERLCTRIAILNRGRVVATGTVDELRRSLGTDGSADLEDLFLRSVGETPNRRGLSWIGDHG